MEWLKPVVERLKQVEQEIDRELDEYVSAEREWPPTKEYGIELNRQLRHVRVAIAFVEKHVTE